MLKLQLSNQVIEILRSYPGLESKTHQKKIQDHLDNYVNILSNELEDKSKYQSAYMEKHNLFKINLEKLKNNSPNLAFKNGKREKLHYIILKHCPLFIIKERNNQNPGEKREYTLIELNKNYVQLLGKTQLQEDIDMILQNPYDHVSYKEDIDVHTLTDIELLREMFGHDLDKNWDDYDLLRVDLESLHNYIDWLENHTTKMNKKSKESKLREASVIYRIASLDADEFGYGKFPMKRHKSLFGRICYTGYNIQNMEKKNMRRAVLGHCYEYDMRSCSAVWKYDIGTKLCEEGINPAQKYNTLFSFIDDKDIMYNTLSKQIFGDLLTRSEEEKLKAIKTIITAIGFGARFTKATKYPADNVKGYVYSALYGVFAEDLSLEKEESGDYYKKCKDNPIIVQLILEHDDIEIKFEKLVAEQDKDFRKKQEFKNEGENSRYSRSKFIAYYYQHYETRLMNKAKKYLEQFEPKINILANIHDAFITDRKSNEIGYIEILLREEFKNPYIKFGFKEHHAFAKTRSKEQDKEEEQRLKEHHEMIALQEKLAQEYFNKSTSHFSTFDDNRIKHTPVVKTSSPVKKQSEYSNDYFEDDSHDVLGDYEYTNEDDLNEFIAKYNESLMEELDNNHILKIKLMLRRKSRNNLF